MTTSAINLENGLSTPNQDTALLKRGYIDIANEVILLSDGSKFGKQSLCIFADIKEIDLIISDNLSANTYHSLINKNIKVEIVK
jgi:DeoR family transcriptional regulator, fructose operon transcriptional repressor